MSALGNFFARAGKLFGFSTPEGGVAPNYPVTMLEHPYRLDPLAWDYVLAQKRVPMVRACVLRIANDIASLPVVFEVESGGAYKPIQRVPGNIVDVWQNANATQTNFELVRDLAANLKASGNAYLIAEDFGTNKVRELWTVPPHIVRVIPGKRREPAAYVVSRGGEEEAIPAKSVIHFKGYNPEFAPDGGSDLEAAEFAYSARHDVDRLIQAFVRNGGQPSGYWSLLDSAGKPMAMAMSEADSIALRKRLDRLTNGIRRAFSAKIIGDMKFERSGLTPSEMKLLEMGDASDETICRALGVPGWMVGLKGGSSGLADKGGAARADAKNYWNTTIKGELKLRDAILTERLCPKFGRGIRARTDLSTVPDLIEAMLASSSSLADLCGRAPYTVNEVRAFSGAPARPEPEADKLYEKPAPAPLGADAGPTPDPGNQAPQDAPARSSRMIEGDTRREERRRAASANLRRYERRLEAAFGEILDRQKKKVCAAIEARQGRALKRRSIDMEEIVMPDPEDEDAISRILAALVADRGEEALADLALELEMAFNAQRTSGWVKANAQRVLAQTSETTREAVREAMAQGMSLNESLAQIVERVRALPAFDNARAALIARTESTGAYNYASREAWAQSGVVMKQEWLSSRDSAVRDTHAEADGQVVGIFENFLVGENQLQYPGDPSGDPGETCNCRCTTLPVVDEAARARVNFKSYLGRVLAGAHREGVAR